MMNRRRNWVKIACRAAMLACAAGLVIYAFAGCATFKNVLRTVDDLASDACAIFGTQNPAEFHELVRQVRPDLAQRAAGKPNANVVKALCDVKEVVQPFIDDQLRIQNGRAAAVRASMARPPQESSDAGP